MSLQSKGEFTLQRVWVLENEPSILGKIRSGDLLAKELKHFTSYSTFQGEVNRLAKSAVRENPTIVVCEFSFETKTVFDLQNLFTTNELSIPKFLVVSQIKEKESIKRCLEFGVVDYLCKPVVAEELIAKIEFHLQKNSASFAGPVNPLYLCPETMSLIAHGKDIAVFTAKEFQIFGILIKKFDQVTSRGEIIKIIWPKSKINNKTFDVHMFNIRKKLWNSEIQVKFCPPDGYRLVYANS